MVDLLDALRVERRLAHQRLLALVADLTDDQLRWRPGPHAPGIGFHLFHLARWAERDRPPQTVIATGRADNRERQDGWSTTRSRPLCDWPKVARYRGTGDLESAESFRCE